MHKIKIYICVHLVYILFCLILKKDLKRTPDWSLLLFAYPNFLKVKVTFCFEDAMINHCQVFANQSYAPVWSCVWFIRHNHRRIDRDENRPSLALIKFQSELQLLMIEICFFSVILLQLYNTFFSRIISWISLFI